MKRFRIISVSVLLIVTLVTSIGVYFYCNYSTLHLSPTLCKNSLNGVSPQFFCENKGATTWLEGKYLFAATDRDGCLIITLKNEVISEWKNTFIDLQILQCVFADTRDIGITVDYTKDFMDYMEDAHTCGFEISEDFTKIVDSPEDNSWYYPFIVIACAKMQMLDGKSCSEVIVEYIEIDNNGEVINKTIFP